MKDTPLQITEKMAELMCQRTPQQRLYMASSMYAMSKKIVISSILQAQPRILPKDLRREVFLRFYGNDFDPAVREKIVKHLMDVSRK